jgi:ubiquinone/menaquinone biosynthesis C-methylase UbiE
MMDHKKFSGANQRAWDEVAPRHQAHHFDQLLASFSRPGFTCLGPVMTQAFASMDYRGKSVAHLCCNNGRELVSLRNTGAGRCVGFDFSAEFIAHAQRLADAAGQDCEFIEADVYAIPPGYDSAFDIVFMSVGTLRWLPDVKQLFQVVARLLKKQGFLFVREMHPILDMFASDLEEDGCNVKYSYFRKQPIERSHGLDYYGQEKYEAASAWHFHHTSSDIISAIITNRFDLLHYQEYPHDISWSYKRLEKTGAGFPMSYSLMARKRA